MWEVQRDGSFVKIVGAFVLILEPRENGEWFWYVGIPDVDEGDQDIAPDLNSAAAAVEDAMDLIIDEMFDDIAMQAEK